jgi:xanthine/uracil permease
MCFSATANFVGSGALAAIGVVTLTRVKHRRELLYAAVASFIILAYFWKSHATRPFRYAEAL